MSAQHPSASAISTAHFNGSGAAAVLAASSGSFLLAVLAILADQSGAIKSFMIFSKATGPLSGVTTCAIVAWLTAWLVLHLRWKRRNLVLRRVNLIAFVLLALGVLLTFPPIADLF